MTLDDLKTPCALVDIDAVEWNTQRMSERMSKLGVRLRPHVKTHKCVEAARLQVRGHFGGITVSTLAEARFFKDAGFGDITYAFPLPPDRAGEAAALGVNVVVDHEAAVAAIEASGKRMRVFLEIDCGDRRAGVDPERPESVELARRIAKSQDFAGVLTHAGHSYDCKSAEKIRAVAKQERDVAVRFAARLREAGIAVREVSVGSTPTMSLAEDLKGVTEARPGNFVFYDAFQAAIGSCTLDDCAFSVLATVAGQYRRENKLIVTAGALALSKDRGARHVDPNCGYGVVGTADGKRLPDLRVTDLSQEHGQIVATAPMDVGHFPVGSRLRIIPNHACLAAAQHDRYFVVRGKQVVAEWKPCRGW